MTRFVRNDDQAASGAKHLKLTITGVHGTYSWSYSNASLILGGETGRVEIELKNETSDGSSASIFNYASTGMTETCSPIKSFELSPGGHLAVLTIGLLRHQLIDFGVFVKMTHGRKETTLFCDPQASNDPVKNF